MIEVDQAMIEDLHLGLIPMMETAGRNLAHLVRTRFLDGDPAGKIVSVLAGMDGIISYGLKGAPPGTAADLIRWANGHSAPISALDVPSGVDAA
jgi:NAD(P)H-hydrate repair Nnr-like enzyme with NAD(P)H-hydrate epimerase domain